MKSLLLINLTLRPRSSRGYSFGRSSTPCGAGFSARFKGGWFISALGRYGQKIDDIDLKRLGNAFDNVEGGVEISALKPADRRAINVSINRKIFLGDSPGGSDRPKIPCNTRAKLHACMGNILSLFYPSDISNIIQSPYVIDQHFQEPQAQPALSTRRRQRKRNERLP